MSILELTKDNFETTISENKDVLLIDFWAEWCGPCRSFANVYEAAADKFQNVKFYKVNIEEEGELAKEFNIRSIPHVMVFKGNVAVYSEPGALGGEQLEKLISDAKNMDLSELKKEIDKYEEKK